MREIKFRFIFKDGNFFAKRYMTLDELLDSDFALEKMEEDINIESNIFDLEDYPDYEVFKSQYTGLKDKNGVEIYESDICKHNDDTAQIMFWEGAFIFRKYAMHDYALTNFACCRTFEVIGNMYENQELLEKES